jgi:hypothetical protein
MYMTPNGRIVLTDEEKKKGKMVLGINACEKNCPNCTCASTEEMKKKNKLS